MPQPRQHFYMASATVHFVTEADTLAANNTVRQLSMNMVVQLPEKKVTSAVLNKTRQALFERLGTENGIPVENCRSIVFNNVFHLGFMTAKEFHSADGMTNPAQQV